MTSPGATKDTGAPRISTLGAEAVRQRVPALSEAYRFVLGLVEREPGPWYIVARSGFNFESASGAHDSVRTGSCGGRSPTSHNICRGRPMGRSEETPHDPAHRLRPIDGRRSAGPRAQG